MTTGTWTDTTQQPRPEHDAPWHWARWLVGRHPQVAELVDRVGAVDVEDGVRWVDLDALKDIVRGRDAYVRAWESYRDRTWEPTAQRPNETPEDFEVRAQAWEDAGPKAAEYEPKEHPGSLQAFGVMSGTEQARLRLLATVGNGRVEWAANDLWGWDEAGRAFFRDWLLVLG